MKSLYYLAGMITFLLCFPTVASAAEEKSQKKRSLESISTVLVSRQYCAMIPKGAILYTPTHIKDKDAPNLKGRLVNWKTFLLKNSGWIHMHHVSMKQAAGKEVIPQEVILAYKSMGKMVIAHNYGDLVSVKPEALLPPVEE